MEFIKSLMTSENAVNLGGGFLLIGIIITFTPRILRGHFEACDQARKALKNEAQQLGQDDRYNRLTAEEKGISKMPMYGKAMMATGFGITVATLIWRVIK